MAEVLIEFNGKIASVAEHCKDLKINPSLVYTRHSRTGESYLKCLEYYHKNGVKHKSKYKVKDRRLYSKWYNTKQKCENPNHHSYKDYDEKGIKVCERWQNYENFENDLLESFLEHVEKFGIKDTTIERKNYNGDYEPANVTWATCKEQQNNKSSNRMITEDLNVKQFAEKYSINYETVRNRLNLGWSVEEILDPFLRDTWKDIIPTGESLDELSNRTGIPKDIIKYRFHIGWDFQKIITTPIQNRIETPTGETVPQIAKRLGISHQAIYQRLKLGWNWQDILNLSSQDTSHKIILDTGETVAELSERTKIPKQIIYNKYKWWSVEKIISTYAEKYKNNP